MEADATKPKAKLRLPQGAKLGVKVGKRGQNTKIQRKRKQKKLERVCTDFSPASKTSIHTAYACLVSIIAKLTQFSAGKCSSLPCAGTVTWREACFKGCERGDEEAPCADGKGSVGQQQGE